MKIIVALFVCFLTCPFPFPFASFNFFSTCFLPKNVMKPNTSIPETFMCFTLRRLQVTFSFETDSKVKKVTRCYHIYRIHGFFFLFFPYQYWHMHAIFINVYVLPYLENIYNYIEVKGCRTVDREEWGEGKQLY